MWKAKRFSTRGFLLLLVFMLIAMVAPVQAQEKYPTRAITVICPFTPGGGTDNSARILAPFLQKKWGVPVNVLNKPGGNTIPAQLEVYNSPPDGYTIYADGQPTSTLVVVKDLPFKIMDRTFIGGIFSHPNMLLVETNSPYKSMNDVIADARKDPTNFSWGSLGGVGGTDLISRQFLKAIGVDYAKTKPVMAKGGLEVLTLAAGGHVKTAWATPIAALPLITAGNLRALAISSKERNPRFPDVPTTAELGYPNANFIFWVGLSGPPKIPAYIVEVWDKTLKEVGKDPEYVAQANKVGSLIFPLNAKEMEAYLAKELKEVSDLFEVKR